MGSAHNQLVPMIATNVDMLSFVGLCAYITYHRVASEGPWIVTGRHGQH